MTSIELTLLAIFGLMIGSFLNVCISRLPAGESIVSPASRCPTCGKPIAWRDNIPVLGYLILGGKCRNCRAPISLMYPAVEAVTAISFVAQGVFFGDNLPLLAARLLFTAMLIVLFGTDLETMAAECHHVSGYRHRARVESVPAAGHRGQHHRCGGRRGDPVDDSLGLVPD